MDLTPEERRVQAQNAEWEERIRPIFERWRKRLNLSNWHINLEMKSTVADRTDAAASIRVLGAFGDIATLALTDDLVYNNSNMQVGRCIAHELIHIVTNEMADYAQQYMSAEQYKWWERLYEQSVDQLARAFVEMEAELCSTDTDATPVEDDSTSESASSILTQQNVSTVDLPASSETTDATSEEWERIRAESDGFGGAISGHPTPTNQTENSAGE